MNLQYIHVVVQVPRGAGELKGTTAEIWAMEYHDKEITKPSKATSEA
jgi:hypothetical protein